MQGSGEEGTQQRDVVLKGNIKNRGHIGRGGSQENMCLPYVQLFKYKYCNLYIPVFEC